MLIIFFFIYYIIFHYNLGEIRKLKNIETGNHWPFWFLSFTAQNVPIICLPEMP